MIQAKCIQKFRDKNNHIYGYRLQDLNWQVQDVQADKLKQAIAKGEIHVINLTLTKDGRLVDTKEHHLQSSKLGKAPQKPVNEEEIFFEKLNEIEKKFCDAIGGDAGCCKDLDKSSGIKYTDQILGAYYPDEYHGDKDDYDHCYGVTLGIECSNTKKEVYIMWQGNNGMASEEFTESAELVKPLYSEKNIEIIRKTMDRFIERTKKWIHNDENGMEQNPLAGVDMKILKEKFKEAVTNGTYPRKTSGYTTADLEKFARQAGMIQ